MHLYLQGCDTENRNKCIGDREREREREIRQNNGGENKIEKEK